MLIFVKTKRILYCKKKKKKKKEKIEMLIFDNTVFSKLAKANNFKYLILSILSVWIFR